MLQEGAVAILNLDRFEGIMRVKTQSIITVNDSVIHAVLDGEALLLNVENGMYFGLEGDGARIWELLQPGATEEEIVAQLRTEYDAKPDVLRRDVCEFVQSLNEKGLTRTVTG